MPPHTIFLDESGDLGWSFDKPYRTGGSSRFLTIAYLIGPSNQHKFSKRLVKKTYEHFHFNPKIEVKGSDLTEEQLDFVSHQIVSGVKVNSDFILGAMTVKKENVQTHIRVDGNKLYNYMIRLSVLPKIAAFSEVHLIRDNRSIKVKSGNSLKDYLQLELWFECNSRCSLIDCPTESNQDLNIMFIDWVSHIVWSKHEDGQAKHCQIISKYLRDEHLFF